MPRTGGSVLDPGAEDGVMSLGDLCKKGIELLGSGGRVLVRTYMVFAFCFCFYLPQV